MKSPSARLHEGSKCSLLHNMNSPARNNKKWSHVIVDNIVVRVEVHEGMNFAENIKGNWHFLFWCGKIIPINTAQSLLQLETRSQGVVVTIRNMKRVNTVQVNINGLRLYLRC